LIILLFILGLEFGSFLNVVIDRLPDGRSLMKPPSHCDNCGTRLKIVDLIPLISYLWLRGRCRYCGLHIPIRVFCVELATGIMFAFLWARYGLSNELWIFAVYACLFIAIFVIDLNTQLILNKMTYPACIFALATVPLRDDLNYFDSVTGNTFIGGVVGFTLLLLVVVVSRGGMGFGDVKMSALMGFALGYPNIFVGLFVGIITGGLVATGLLIMKRKGRKQAIPFGPFLAIGAMTALIWGDAIWDWYTTPFN
jgi:leader peptidase (prepilin peptidase) / N-methyltransferase